MKNISFKQLFRAGEVVSDNKLFLHYSYPEMPLVYDYNAIQFKQMPHVKEFILVEQYLQGFQQRQKQQHLKFCFPENEPLSFPLIEYLSGQGYGQCLIELYGIHPNQFPFIEERAAIEVFPVTKELLPAYLHFQYRLDIQFGPAFAEQKQRYYETAFSQDGMLQLLACYEGVPAGSLDVIVTENTAELDNLIVVEPFRKKGIATRLQQYVMRHYPDKIVILAADGYDTAKEMYRKQNYQYLGYRYEVLKLL